MRITQRQYQAAILVLAGIALLAGIVTTWKYGAGVSSDAVRAMSTAEGLLAGKGFVDFVGARYVLWPPLYPMVLAAISLVTRLDIFHVAWYLNLLLFPLNTWLWGKFFERVFPENLGMALLGCAAAVLSSSMVRIYANAASDPLFVTFMVIFFLTAARYLQTGRRGQLWSMFALAGLAMLQRYLGVVLLGTAVLVVIRQQGWKGIWEASLPALTAAIPLAAWLVIHNYMLNGTFLGPRAYGEMWPLENISLSLTKILHWFLPYAPGLKPLLMRPWTILAAAAVVVLLLNVRDKENWRAWWKALMGEYVWPQLLFSVVYFFLLAFTVNTIDHRDLTSDRYYIIIFPSILIFLLLSWKYLIVVQVNARKVWEWVFLAAAIAWFMYPLYDLQEYLRLALVQGEPSNYNIYNSRHFTEMQVVQEGRRLTESDPEATIYSNYVNLLWFQYKKPIHRLLPVNNDLPQEQRMEQLQTEHPGWPGEEDGYIIWFVPNEYKYLAGPEDLAMLADLELIYRDKNGEIYRVSGR